MMKEAIKAGLEWKKIDLIAFKFKNSYLLFALKTIKWSKLTLQFISCLHLWLV